MRALYFDGESGVAGDMILGSLFALGIDHEQLTKILAPIAPGPFTFRVETVSVNGVTGRRVHVDTNEERGHRSLSEVTQLLDRGGLSATVRA
ncbi:MAG: DUF111 family protein, partial [candidate division Zixibacteria bacterium]|nr:DUF111 family protein [candidate division Zixibacteria bacterium]